MLDTLCVEEMANFQNSGSIDREMNVVTHILYTHSTYFHIIHTHCIGPIHIVFGIFRKVSKSQ